MIDDDESYLTADGFEDAFIGVSRPWQANLLPVAMYDASKCIDIIMRDNECDHEEALEHFEFNVTGGYVGDQTPIFVYLQDNQ